MTHVNINVNIDGRENKLTILCCSGTGHTKEGRMNREEAEDKIQLCYNST